LDEKLKNSLSLSAQELDYILSPVAIRERAAKIFELTKDGKTKFTYNQEKLRPTVELVLRTIRKNYPDLKIPFHSRWGHFRVGGLDRVKQVDERLAKLNPTDRARSKLDLVITSVLLDAGAGPDWKYVEKQNGKTFNRSEGLGVASLQWFCDGGMSKNPMQADKEGLRSVSSDALADAFQVTKKNPLVGVEGRVHLLNNLAFALDNKTIFRDGRPGNILDYLVGKFGTTIPATGILRAVLDGFGPIWPGRLSSGGVNLGDVWTHSGLGSPGTFESLMPFHKLSQWMTYSLIEPILEAGCTVKGVEELTGLAEYRNGGLIVDSGLVALKNPEDKEKSWSPDNELIIEWRALTIHLLDKIGEDVRKALKLTPAEFPLAKVLEGGTWWAGRTIAREKRDSGEPPIKIQSDGTVF
jgi:hypothetical protein